MVWWMYLRWAIIIRPLHRALQWFIVLPRLINPSLIRLILHFEFVGGNTLGLYSEMLGSNLNRDFKSQSPKSWPSWRTQLRFSVVFVSPFRHLPRWYLDLAMTASFCILSHVPFIQPFDAISSTVVVKYPLNPIHTKTKKKTYCYWTGLSGDRKRPERPSSFHFTHSIHSISLDMLDMSYIGSICSRLKCEFNVNCVANLMWLYWLFYIWFKLLAQWRDLSIVFDYTDYCWRYPYNAL